MLLQMLFARPLTLPSPEGERQKRQRQRQQKKQKREACRVLAPCGRGCREAAGEGSCKKHKSQRVIAKRNY
jgi:sulfatase maturation enzyme AslB (radical SAM superfamily)